MRYHYYHGSYIGPIEKEMNFKERMAKIEEFRVLADKGDAYAARMVAGLSLLDDYETVLRYANMAVELSGGTEHEALNILGCCYEYGSGCEKDLKKAFDYYLKASELGNDESQFKLGSMYLIGDVVPKDPDKAEEWLSKSAAAGNKMGEEYLAYVKMAKEGSVSHLNMMRAEDGERKPFITMAFSNGEKLNIWTEREYFGVLDEMIKAAKEDTSVKNLYKVKDFAIMGMHVYYERRDIYNNELIYDSVKPFASDPDCDDFGLLLRDWAIENSYGILRCAAKEKEGLNNILECVSLTERLYLFNPNMSLRGELIKQYRQAAAVFESFGDKGNAKKHSDLADKLEIYNG